MLLPSTLNNGSLDRNRRWLRHRTGGVQAALALGMAVALSFPAAVDAGQRGRAKLSKTLADRIEARSDEPVQIIVDGDRAQIERLARRYNLEVKRHLRRGGVLEVTGGQLDALARDPDVTHLSADSVVRPTMAVTHQAIGADQAWEGTLGLGGVTGAGVGIAIIDSGIASHADLGRRVVVSVDFVSDKASRRVKARGRSRGGDKSGKKTRAGKAGGASKTDSAGVASKAGDPYGHGTHVAGIAAAKPGKRSPDTYPGIAPGAHLISLRVLDDEGIGRVSDVIDAIDWAIENKDRYGIRILNLSLGAPVDESYLDDPLAMAAERAVAAGLIVVCSAGNYGTTDDGTPIVGGIVSPGHAPSVITVGALKTQGTPERSDDTVATYSSRGPTPFDGLLKPDLVAAGNKVVSLEAPRSYLARTYPELHVSGGKHGYFELSGTSMSAAVTSGAAALLLQANPTLTPAQVKLALQLSASPVPGAGLIEAGAGSLNVLLALHTAVHGPGVAAPETTIAGEAVAPGGIAFGSRLVWGDALIWGNSLVEGNALIWGNTLIWGNEPYRERRRANDVS